MITTTGIQFNPTAPQGWECPKCGRVYSPYTSMCSYCPAQLTWFDPSIWYRQGTGELTQTEFYPVTYGNGHGSCNVAGCTLCAEGV